MASIDGSSGELKNSAGVMLAPTSAELDLQCEAALTALVARDHTLGSAQGLRQLLLGEPPLQAPLP